MKTSGILSSFRQCHGFRLVNGTRKSSEYGSSMWVLPFSVKKKPQNLLKLKISTQLYALKIIKKEFFLTQIDINLRLWLGLVLVRKADRRPIFPLIHNSGCILELKRGRINWWVHTSKGTLIVNCFHEYTPVLFVNCIHEYTPVLFVNCTVKQRNEETPAMSDIDLFYT